MVQTSKYDLISIGDASLDVFIVPSETESLCQLDDRDSLICFSYGDKVPVKEMEFSIGGNAANNAVGVSRLGVDCAVVLTLGDDDIAEQIVGRLDKEGVDTTYVVRQPSTGSNYSTIINYSGERTILTYKVPRSYEFPTNLPIAPWVYLTSMGDSFRPFYNHLTNWLKQNPQVKLAFNPGSRQLRAGIETLKEVISLTTTIFVNREEAEKLTGLGPSRGKEKELLTALTKLGVKKPIVTDGANGSFVYDGSQFFKAGILPIDAHERTGAGDAFGAGCLAALVKGKSFDEALIWGTVNSTSVIGYTGSQKGLLKEAEMEVWLERARTGGVKTEVI